MERGAGEQGPEPIRIQRMRDWLERLTAQIMAADKGQVVFDFGGDSVAAKVLQSYQDRN